MENNVMKVCSFYVSDWHLTAMILPYIEDAEEKGEYINTILEKNLSYNMQEILTRIKISDKKKEKLMKIGWENKNLIKYGELKKYFEKITKEKGKISIIIEGTREKIETINKGIEKLIKKSEKKLKRNGDKNNKLL